MSEEVGLQIIGIITGSGFGIFFLYLLILRKTPEEIEEEAFRLYILQKGVTERQLKAIQKTAYDTTRAALRTERAARSVERTLKYDERRRHAEERIKLDKQILLEHARATLCVAHRARH